jgi:CHASE2 domain-containing sensor protein
MTKVRIAYITGTAAAVAVTLLALLSLFNIIHFAIWLPAIPALVGVMATAGAFITRLENENS